MWPGPNVALILATRLACHAGLSSQPCMIEHVQKYRRQDSDTIFCAPLARCFNTSVARLPKTWYCPVTPMIN